MVRFEGLLQAEPTRMVTPNIAVNILDISSGCLRKCLQEKIGHTPFTLSPHLFLQFPMRSKTGAANVDVTSLQVL